MAGKNTSGMEIDDDGNVIVYESEHDKERRFRKERLENIRGRITDMNYDPAEASRLIAIEIARVAEDLSDCIGNGVVDNIRLKVYEQQLRALRELGKQLTDADTLSKKDILNFDGRKFQFVARVWVDNFVKAMKEAGVPEDLRSSIMKHYRDEMQVSEPRIRKDTLALGSK